MRRESYRRAAVCFAFLLPFFGDSLPRPTQSPVYHDQELKQLTIDPDNWQTLAKAVDRASFHFEGALGYYIKDLKTGRIVSFNEQRLFPSASLIKMPIMAAVYLAAQQGKIDLNRTIVLSRRDKRGGSGVLKRAPSGTVYTNRELVELMIIHSDNTATELLVRQLGFPYLKDAFQTLGLKGTEAHPEGFKLTGKAVSADNYTTASDMAYILEKIYLGQLVSPDASAEMLGILKRQKMRDRLPKFLPESWTIAHKTGLLRKACHDVGIVFSPSGDYLICVMTANEKTYRAAKMFIASIGRITFDYYKGSLEHLNAASDQPTAG